MNKEKILIIGDDQAFTSSLSEALKKEGYYISVSSNGLNGLRMMEDSVLDLVILDITLPDIESYDLLAKKQSNLNSKKTPVFLVSTKGVPINMRKVPEGSVSEFITSLHLSTEELVDKVNRKFGHESNSSSSIDRSENKKKILWVEDDKLIGTILAKKLISAGFDLFHAKSGEEALEALRNVIPDAIVMDLLLPGISGFDTIQTIKKDEALKNVPVMVLSNLSKPSDMERARALGVQKFIIKATASLEQIAEEVGIIARK